MKCWSSSEQGGVHDDLYGRLQEEAELGGRLERGAKLALGFLDVRHDGITAELKVERRTRSRGRLLRPGVPENSVFTLEPALHGMDNPEAPSLVACSIL